MINPEDIEILTIPNVNYHYKIVGLVKTVAIESSHYSSNSTLLEKAIRRLQHEAMKRGATAVIGLLITHNATHNTSDVVTTIVLCGTAIVKIE